MESSMPLLNLPNELLQHIAEQLDDVAAINAFARTTRHLYDLLNRHLYRYDEETNSSSSLFWAAQHDRVATVQIALNHGIYLYPDEKDHIGLLFVAAWADAPALVEFLLTTVPGLTPSIIQDGAPLVVAAAQYGSNAVLSYLFSRDDVDPDIRTIRGATALWYAALDSYPATMRLLMSTGWVNINAVNPDKRTTIFTHIRKKLAFEFHSGTTERVLWYAAALEVLLDYEGCDLGEGQDVDDDETELHDLLSGCMTAGLAGVMELLLRRSRRPIDSFTKHGGTFLVRMMETGHVDIARVLVGRGADVNQRDGEGRTVLSLAARNGHEDVARVLLDVGAVVDAPDLDSDGSTPLRWAVMRGHGPVAMLLLDHGAAVPAFPDTHILNIVLDCLKADPLEGRDMRFAQPIDPKSVGEFGSEALSIAADWGDVELVKFLLEQRALDVNRTMPLYYAARQWNLLVLKLLLADPRIDVNVQTRRGHSPLSWTMSELLAIWMGEKDSHPRLDDLIATVRLLLGHPDTTIIRCKEEAQELLAEAERRGETDLVELLSAPAEEDG